MRDWSLRAGRARNAALMSHDDPTGALKGLGQNSCVAPRNAQFSGAVKIQSILFYADAIDVAAVRRDP